MLEGRKRGAERNVEEDAETVAEGNKKGKEELADEEGNVTTLEGGRNGVACGGRDETLEIVSAD